ncbi:MAG: ArnT family glycosyltransferase [Conexibacter sp.]
MPVEAPPVRPPLLPAARWGRAALALLLLATLCRSLMFASSQPTLLAPDEDYHFHYVNYLVTQHALPTVRGNFATAETYAMAGDTGLGVFLQGPMASFSGTPHAVVATLDRLPGGYRKPTAPGTRNVLHTPGWHAGAAAVDRLAGGSSPVTRLTLMRYYSAVLGTIAVFFAWLLAAQVLARTWQALAAASLLTFQPIAAFSSSTMTNDVLVLLGFTATLAWCAFLLRSAPRSRQGVGLGLALTVALLAKSTALALVPLVGLTLLLVLATHRAQWRAVLGIAAWGAGIPLVLAGWWYIYARSQTGSFLGGSAAVGATLGSEASHGIGHLPQAVYTWFANVYPGYWFEYLGYEVKQHDVWFYLPLVVGLLGIAGLAWRLVALRRTLLRPEAAELRQLVLLICAPLVLLGPPLFVDVVRELHGLPFAENQARFQMAAFPAVAVLMIVGLRQLTSRAPRAFPAATGLLVALAAVFYWHDYVVWGLERFYGPLGAGLDTLLRNAGWLKPEWVGPAWFIALFAISALATLAAFALTVVGVRRERPGGDPALAASGSTMSAAATPAVLRDAPPPDRESRARR